MSVAILTPRGSASDAKHERPTPQALERER
jgi:hypothetical protein